MRAGQQRPFDLFPPPCPGAAYYRGAQGIILVYDVTRAETFDSLADIWLREVRTLPGCQPGRARGVGRAGDGERAARPGFCGTQATARG